MERAARSPEELDTLLEDALVVGDGVEVSALFDDGAVLAAAGRRAAEARGADAIGRVLAEGWSTESTYVAGVRRVLRARDTALVVSGAGIHVARRGGDGAWRLAISLLDFDQATEGGMA